MRSTDDINKELDELENRTDEILNRIDEDNERRKAGQEEEMTEEEVISGLADLLGIVQREKEITKELKKN